MEAVHTTHAGEIKLVWDDRKGFELTVTGCWPTPEQLAEMVAELLVSYRERGIRGN
jgi:hypothetical protein